MRALRQMLATLSDANRIGLTRKLIFELSSVADSVIGESTNWSTSILGVLL